jgi:hypothetical protein
MRQAHYVIIVEHDCVLYLFCLILNATVRKKLLTVRCLSFYLPVAAYRPDEILPP